MDQPQERAGEQLRERALRATEVCFTISDPNQPDNPLVWVNPAFERISGYRQEGVIGRNCRFLQGPATDPAAVQEIRAGMAARRPTVTTLLNYRADGSTFWNEVAISPVLDDSGRLTHFVGVQNEVTRRVQLAAERERLLALTQRSRAAAELAQQTLRLLAEVSELLSSTMDVELAQQRVLKALVPAIADWCAIHVLERPEQSTRVPGRRVSTRHVDPDLDRLGADIERRSAQELSAQTAVVRVLSGGPAELVRDVVFSAHQWVSRDASLDRRDADLGEADTEPLGQLYERLGLRDAVVVPVAARGAVLGALALAVGPRRRRYEEVDLAVAEDLGRRLGMAVDNAQLYWRDHSAAEALQRSMLPVLPRIAGIESAARYLPSSQAAHVGGDWYDVLALPDGSVGLAVGDVMGHDISAAAAMGQLRSVLRSYAWEGQEPSTVLERLDRLVQGLEMAQLATCVYARLSRPQRGGEIVLQWANAGHPPVILRRPDGSCRLLTEASGMVIGAGELSGDERRTQQQVPLAAGSTLLLFTDGLVESRAMSLDDGLARLLSIVQGQPVDLPPKALVDEVVPGCSTRARARTTSPCWRYGC